VGGANSQTGRSPVEVDVRYLRTAVGIADALDESEGMRRSDMTDMTTLKKLDNLLALAEEDGEHAELPDDHMLFVHLAEARKLLREIE